MSAPLAPRTGHTPPVIVRPEDRGGDERYRVAVLTGVALVGLYLLIFIAVLTRNDYDTWAAYALAPILGGIGFAILRPLLAKVEPDAWIRRLILFGLGAKLLGGFARFYANEYVLGHGDAKGYYLNGSAMAAEFRQLIFGGPAFQLAVPNFTGTRFIRLVTSIPYVLTGSTQLGGYIIFTFLSFWGLYLFYRAFCIAVPDGLRRRYAMLVFFLPSMVFWPSSIGKEAWMTTMLGLGSYSLARLLTQRVFAYPGLLVAIAGMGIVRPHVAAIFGAATAAALLLRRSRGQGGTFRKILGLMVLAIAAGILMNQLQAFFDIESPLDAQAVFDETTRRSGQGGSQFQSVQPTSPAALPWAVVTVLFRPFLFEAGSLAGVVTALEGTLLMALFLWNIPRLARVPAAMIQRPYIGFAVIYALVFVFAFSAVSNFGILARQRTQLFPIVVTVLAIPIKRSVRTRKDFELGSSQPADDVPQYSGHEPQSSEPQSTDEETTEEPDPRYRNLAYRPEPAGSPVR